MKRGIASELFLSRNRQGDGVHEKTEQNEDVLDRRVTAPTNTNLVQ